MTPPVRTAVVEPARCSGVSSGRRGSPCRPADRGAVTVEAALALGSLAMVTALAIGALAAAGASVRCTDAARELARLAARGEPDRGRAVAARLAPPGAAISLTLRGDEATAEVTAPPLSLLPVKVSGRAIAVLEPGALGEAGAPGPPGATGPPGITSRLEDTGPPGEAGRPRKADLPGDGGPSVATGPPDNSGPPVYSDPPTGYGPPAPAGGPP